MTAQILKLRRNPTVILNADASAAAFELAASSLNRLQQAAIDVHAFLQVAFRALPESRHLRVVK